MAHTQRKGKTMKKLGTKLFSTAALTLSLSGAAHAVECGDTIGPNEKVVLTRDLLCPSNVDVALTVVGPATLDMNGYTITCLAGLFSDYATDNGVYVLGKSARIKDGTISSCLEAMVIKGEGRHRIEKVHASDSKERGFQVLSDNNTLRRNRASSTSSYGFYVVGSKNRLQDNIADGGGAEGFVLGQAHRTTLTRNLAAGNGRSGFMTYSDGDGIKFIKNEALNNGWDGFAIRGGQKHQLVRNVAKGNEGSGVFISDEVIRSRLTRNTFQFNREFDISQAAPHCEGNRWTRNTFNTSNVDCVE